MKKPGMSQFFLCKMRVSLQHKIVFADTSKRTNFAILHFKK